MRVWGCHFDYQAFMDQRSDCIKDEFDMAPNHESCGWFELRGSRVVSGETYEITLHPDVEIHNGKGESMGMGCYPRGDVVGGNGECAMFALPPGRYLLILDALADKEAGL
jgi:hypothetical protein